MAKSYLGNRVNRYAVILTDLGIRLPPTQRVRGCERLSLSWLLVLARREAEYRRRKGGGKREDKSREGCGERFIGWVDCGRVCQLRHIGGCEIVFHEHMRMRAYLCFYGWITSILSALHRSKTLRPDARRLCCTRLVLVGVRKGQLLVCRRDNKCDIQRLVDGCCDRMVRD